MTAKQTGGGIEGRARSGNGLESRMARLEERITGEMRATTLALDGLSSEIKHNERERSLLYRGLEERLVSMGSRLDTQQAKGERDALNRDQSFDKLQAEVQAIRENQLTDEAVKDYNKSTKDSQKTFRRWMIATVLTVPSTAIAASVVAAKIALAVSGHK